MNGLSVDIEVTSNNEYFGPMYIGSNFEYCRLVYDTTSAWTSVLVAKAKGAKMVSEYDMLKSDTDVAIFHEVYDPNTQLSEQVHEQATNHFGAVQLHGMKETEYMCLK